jgi:hypothetical protein
MLCGNNLQLPSNCSFHTFSGSTWRRSTLNTRSLPAQSGPCLGQPHAMATGSPSSTRHPLVRGSLSSTGNCLSVRAASHPTPPSVYLCAFGAVGSPHVPGAVLMSGLIIIYSIFHSLRLALGDSRHYHKNFIPSYAFSLRPMLSSFNGLL